ncbi:uncharacterized protein PITG_21416 [Phytophthora infestans T30-4]|uniref:Uncharacterized protein n=1 Tax=Phytophthora infestans (strain T30-4) TaxID=403677 RepID=D0P3M9_PHYIT|nr:uncharacterized protein PITG_21416 [Phytophthora infestans T30-4]EEY60276.1 conserved hypothetical protein [Phytophthora infestans T30-4]|eukprot:XP_002895095.1 conserved hypothetical protein [Phytophthora infestans T30-4]
MLARAAARRAKASHAEQDTERGQEIMEIDELESPHISGQPVQRRCQLRIEEEIDGNQHRRQVVVQEEMNPLQVALEKAETASHERHKQLTIDQRIGEMQQQTDTQLRDFGNRFKSTQAELPQRVETLVKLSLERRNDSLLDQLQQKLLEAQAQHLRDIESKNQNSLAAISAKLDKAAFISFDYIIRDSSFVVRAQSIKSLSAILLKFPRDEEAHNLPTSQRQCARVEMLELVIAPMNNENDFVGASPDGHLGLCPENNSIKIIEVERRTSVLGTKIEAGQPAISQGVNTEVVASSLKGVTEGVEIF